VKKLVYDADAAAVDQHDYEDIMARAVNAFLEHAEEEEAGQLQTLKSKLSPEENDVRTSSHHTVHWLTGSQRIARNFLKARTMSPERPHPWAPQTGGIAQKAVAAQGRPISHT
jgi:nitroimidazol reductase NimA-like FMN-containing flavoprotein (pyridoxamine 5'-phosphate oxidase superfamily)